MENLSVQTEGLVSMLGNALLYAYTDVSYATPGENLSYNDIYQGIYTLNNEEYFCLMKKKDENHFLDLITGDLREIKNFNIIILYNEISFVKYIQLKYKTNKNLDIFKFNNYNFSEYRKYINILRFFNLSTPYVITSPIVEQSILDDVIEKIKKYFKKYDKSNMVDIYITQLKKFNTLKDILNFCPKELLDIKIPFWISIIKDYEFYDYRLTMIPCKTIETINILNLNVIDIYGNREKIENEINKLIEVDRKTYREKSKIVIEKRIKDGKETILNEINDAKEKKDVETIFEINIIKEELDKIETCIGHTINNLEMETNPEEWWPELLYPIPEDIRIDNIEDEKITDMTRLLYIL
jgi:hypothetical protein